MSDKLFRGLVIATAIPGLAGLFIRPESGVDRMPGFYPIIAIVLITAVVLVARLLARVIRRPEDEYDAD